MGKKYIIELEDENYHQYSDSEPSDYLWRVKGFNALVFDEVGISKLTPYTEPDLELIKEKAHTNGYGEGYQDGYSEGMNDYLQNPEVKEESDRAYAHGYSDAESKFSEIRKEAYEKGFKDAAHNCEETCTFVAKARNEGYNEGQRAGERHGMKLAWEAARKLWEIDISTLHKIFYKETRMDCYMYYTAAEVVAKIKEYEDKQEEIKIGNEVKAFEKKPFIVTGFGYGDNEEDVYCYGFVTENGISTSAKKNNCVRTGRHFPEIAAIFEKTRNGSNAQIDTE